MFIVQFPPVIVTQKLIRPYRLEKVGKTFLYSEDLNNEHPFEYPSVVVAIFEKKRVASKILIGRIIKGDFLILDNLHPQT